jgi:hypothetical protein
MNLLKSLLLFLFVLVLVTPLVHAQSVDCPRSGAPVTIDGKWDGSEWDDAAELHLVKSSDSSQTGEGFVRVKYDDSYFYAIVDFVSVSTASGTDGAGIQFDTNNDGGNTPKQDDYRFDADYRGQGSMAQGTGSDFRWGLPLLRGALVDASISSSPHSSKSHPIYEFRIPLSIFPKTSTARFAAAVWHGSNTPSFVLVTWPQDYYLVVPNTWGTINFATPVPEFTCTFVIIVLALAAATLVTRTRAKKRIQAE